MENEDYSKIVESYPVQNFAARLGIRTHKIWWVRRVGEEKSKIQRRGGGSLFRKEKGKERTVAKQDKATSFQISHCLRQTSRNSD